ncbi:RnfABCDGE type electron transport complex subunit D, partial [uncultured Traorella sp.]|uniref:RnfABCDGE type electron transport complex subunit D n=1 Tax=uncultured Traorella sp. TaxID=1929048 RepID=UPI0025F34593
MKFNYSPAPNYRSSNSTKRIMFELLLGLIVIYLYALFYYATSYGNEYLMQALLIMAASVGGCVLTEVVWALALKKNVISYLKGSFPWITGVILGLMVSVNTSWYAVLVAAVLCTIFGKLAFGGFGQNIFNPAAVGRAIILTAFSGMVAADITTGATPTTLMASTYSWCVTDAGMVSELLNSVGGLSGLLFGSHPGALGETCGILIIVVGIILAIRKVIDWRVPVVYIGSVFVITAVMALFKGMGMWYPVYHVLSRGLLFGAFFMATDPVTNPTSASGRVIFALGCAILTVLIRVKANLPEGVLYSILLMNACTPMIERICDCEQIKGLRNAIISFVCLAVVGLGCGVLAINAVEPATAAKEENNGSTNEGETGMDFNTEITNTTENSDGSVTYTVSVDGYAVYNHADGKPNVIEVTILDGTVQNVVVVEANDTQYVGDQIANEDFTSQFVGMTLDTLEVKPLSGATISSTSAEKAVQAALEAAQAPAGGNGSTGGSETAMDFNTEGTNTTENRDGRSTYTISAEGYAAYNH